MALYLSDTSSTLSSPPSSPKPPLGFYSFSTQNCEDNQQVISRNPVKLTEQPGISTRNAGSKGHCRPRITKHLDLSLPALGAGKESLDLLLVTLRKRKKIVVVAGAGISVSSGIPDFRSSHGLFTTLRKDHKLKASGKQLFDASVYLDRSMTSTFHDMVRSLSDMAATAQPSAFHRFLSNLATEQRLLRLYTQNIDGIDESLPLLNTQVPLPLGSPWPRTIQLHGGLKKMTCHKCRHTSDFKAELFHGPDPPLCAKCCEADLHRMNTGQRRRGVGKLRPRIVLYNEDNPDEEAIGSVVRADLRTRPDALVVVGTSLKIPGVRRIVKEMCRVVHGRKDGVTIWINHDAAPLGREFEQCWDLVVKGNCDDVADLAGLRGKEGHCESEDIFDVCSVSEAEQLKREQTDKIAVVVRTSTGVGQGEKVCATTLAHSGNAKGKNSFLGESQRPRKARVRKTLSTKEVPAQRKIQSAFRVSKSNTKKETKQGSSMTTNQQPSGVTHPVSLVTARSSGPIFPGLLSSSKSQVSEAASWNEFEIISPSGSVPSDIPGILVD
ncbi:hypothetical protein LOZ58_006823 [Ophidiomyces ophidiicola]|nr:hypothetical protein LOZ65_002128 [Ophidiomyces ophidiicola]KAI1932490.1 hypothetical protein LOZ66_006864 [Ophidiomyces ophidiicola]KAI1955174.1 hypothetical protein LOZ58_006823 [Ophidiomyces ophidiicola]